MLAGAIEIADNEASGQPAIDLDAMIAAGLRALDNFSCKVCAFDAEIPTAEDGEMLEHEHGEAVGFLSGGAGGAPETDAAVGAAGLNQFWQQFGAQEFEGM